MSEEEKIELIYAVYGYTSALGRARRDVERIASEMESRIVSDILSSSIGVRLLEEIRRIVRDEVRRAV